MATIEIRTGNSEGQNYDAYPAGTYYCQIRDAEVTESKFKAKDGSAQYQLKITWEVTRLTEEQEEAELETGKWFRQWFGLWYGVSKRGASNLKVFIDSLLSQELLAEFNPQAFDPDVLIGIEQRVTVGIKTGEDGGEYNTVLSVAPLKLTKRSATPAAKSAAPAPVKRKATDVPDVDEQGVGEEEMPF